MFRAAKIAVGYQKWWKSVGPFSDPDRSIGLKRRAMVAGLKAVDFFSVPFKPDGVQLETLRAQIINDPFWRLVSEEYNIGTILERLTPREGLANKPVIIRTTKGRFVLKEQKGFDSPSEIIDAPPQDKIRFEAEVAKHLQQKGFPYPQIYNNRNGDPFIVYKGRCFVLYEFLCGEINAIDDARRFKFIAAYHNAVQDFPNPERASLYFFPKRIERLRKKFQWFTEIKKSFEKCSEPDRLLPDQFPEIARYVEKVLSKYDDSLLPKLVIHGDFNPGNVLSRTGKPSGLIDPEFTYDPRIGDLTTLPFSFKDEINEDLIIGRLRAYQNSVSFKFLPAELAALENFFLIEALEILLWYHEKYQKKIAGEKIEWITDQRIKDQLAVVHRLLQLDWGVIQSALTE